MPCIDAKVSPFQSEAGRVPVLTPADARSRASYSLFVVGIIRYFAPVVKKLSRSGLIKIFQGMSRRCPTAPAVVYWS